MRVIRRLGADGSIEPVHGERGFVPGASFVLRLANGIADVAAASAAVPSVATRRIGGNGS